MDEAIPRRGRIDFLCCFAAWMGREWHESPKPQWVVPLSDQWFIETQDGARPEMGSGDIYWGQDIDTRAVDDNRGHRSGQIGNEPCVHLMIQLKAPQVEGVACPFAAAGASFSCSAGTREMGDAVLRAL